MTSWRFNCKTKLSSDSRQNAGNTSSSPILGLGVIPVLQNASCQRILCRISVVRPKIK